MERDHRLYHHSDFDNAWVNGVNWQLTCCFTKSSRGFCCTRHKGHSGLHAAHDVSVEVGNIGGHQKLDAVWGVSDPDLFVDEGL